MNPQSAGTAFAAVVDEIGADFAANPLQYGNEDMVVPEFVYRLRQRIDPEYLPVEYRQAYADHEKWRVRDFRDRIESVGSASRVRPEVGFVEDGERWRYERRIDGEVSSTNPKYDIVVFGPNRPLVGQSKKEGPGNYWDLQNDIAVLCEAKHSKNEASNFYAPSQGADDVRALARYPGQVGRRVFVFFDWWPVDGNGHRRYSDHRERLLENVGAVANPVDVVYLSRTGDHHRFTIESS
jgi:hypothetical protein